MFDSGGLPRSGEAPRHRNLHPLAALANARAVEVEVTQHALRDIAPDVAAGLQLDDRVAGRRQQLLVRRRQPPVAFLEFGIAAVLGARGEAVAPELVLAREPLA